jgi:hypothetical protein
VGYITLVIGSQVAILQWHVRWPDENPAMFRLALAAVLMFNTLLSFAAAMLPLRLGLRNLQATEF